MFRINTTPAELLAMSENDLARLKAILDVLTPPQVYTPCQTVKAAGNAISDDLKARYNAAGMRLGAKKLAASGYDTEAEFLQAWHDGLIDGATGLPIGERPDEPQGGGLAIDFDNPPND